MRRLPVARAVVRTGDERVRRARELRGWLMAPVGVLPGELPVEVESWPADARDLFEERAGICEFHGGLTREMAEREAERCVRAQFARPEPRGPPLPR